MRRIGALRMKAHRNSLSGDGGVSWVMVGKKRRDRTVRLWLNAKKRLGRNGLSRGGRQFQEVYHESSYGQRSPAGVPQYGLEGGDDAG